MRDNVSKLGTVVNALGLSANKNNITGVSVDLSQYNAATVYIMAGTWTDGTHTFTIKESADNSTFTAVAATDLYAWIASAAGVSNSAVRVGNSQPAAISSAPTALNQRIGYNGSMRYIRVDTVVTGSPATGAQYDVVIVAGEGKVMPSAV